MDSGCDPYMPLLQYRNAQLFDFNKSPAELLFNRPLKTKLPVMPNALLSTESDRNTRLRLQRRHNVKSFIMTEEYAICLLYSLVTSYV